MNEYQDLWNKVREKLSYSLTEQQYNELFEDVKHVIKEENGVIFVQTPNSFTNHRINKLCGMAIPEILEKLTDKKLRIRFVCEDEIEKPVKNSFVKLTQNNLNANYTFESIVVGESNRLGYLTALKVADNPGTFVNPLYIFGGVGLGKTHMMQAIGNYIADSNVNNKILYVQANEYIEDYGKATRDKNLKAFEEKYDNLDVLLVDDIQMLAKGRTSQDEFFKLFEKLSTNQKQIVITSDCPAAKLDGIMDRLTSRFQRGISVDIKQPDLTLRMNILKRKLAETSEVSIDDEVLNYIAENFTDNVRELEGALTRVLWVSEVYNQKPNLQTTIEALEILIKAKKPSATVDNNYENALSVIANMYNINVIDLLGSSRNSKYVLPRHIAMYILKDHYNLTYARIGKILNGRDHTTIMNGYKKMENDLKTDEQLKMAVESVLKKI